MPLPFRAAALTLVVLIAGACSTAQQEDVTGAAPQAAVRPSDEPEIFGRGIISTPLPEFATSFSPRGDTVYFNVATEDRSTLRIVKSTFADGRWSDPEGLPFSDGSYRDVDPFVTRGGERLYFSSNRPIEGEEPKEDFDIWYVERSGAGWSEPVHPGAPLNGERNEVFVSATNTGVLYFGAFDEGAGHIYRTRERNGRFDEAERVALGLEEGVSVANPMIAPDESFLVFSSSMLPGEGESDLFLVRRTEDGVWGEIANLGRAVNSGYADFAPWISPDGQSLFFTSERPGVVGAGGEGRPPGDLYRVSIPQGFR